MTRTIRILAFLFGALAGAAVAQEPVVDVKPSDLAQPPEPEASPSPAPSPSPSPAPAATKPSLRLAALAGGMVSMSSGADEEAAPLLRLTAEAPLAAYVRPPRLIVDAALAALPGETLSVEQVQTVRSLELRAGLAWQPFASFYFSFAGWAGFATRIESDPEPLDRTAKFAGGSVLFDDRNGNALEIGFGGDQRLDGHWQPTATVSGSVRLWEASDGKVDARLVARAILLLDTSLNGQAPSDVVQVGMCIAR